MYEIPCKCDEAVYIEETCRLFETRRKEQASKIRLTEKDIKNGRLKYAEERMGKENGGLARHSVDCESEIDWEKARDGLRQRKVREGVEPVRQQYSGHKVLNNFEQLMLWKPLLTMYFQKEQKNARARAVDFVRVS